jgi:hypothetical protein
MRANEAYWQPQPPEVASPQHEAFSDGSQHEACLTGAQQLDVSAPGCGMPAWPWSCADGDDSTDRSNTLISMRILRFNPIPVLRVNQRRTSGARRSRQEVNVDHAHTRPPFGLPSRRSGPPLTSTSRPSMKRDGSPHEKTQPAPFSTVWGLLIRDPGRAWSRLLRRLRGAGRHLGRRLLPIVGFQRIPHRKLLRSGRAASHPARWGHERRLL